MNIYNAISEKKGNKSKKIAVLVDPDKTNTQKLVNIIEIAAKNDVDFFFVGGSLLTNDTMELTIKTIKDHCNVPVVLFPGNTMQVNKNADAI